MWYMLYMKHLNPNNKNNNKYFNKFKSLNNHKSNIYLNIILDIFSISYYTLNIHNIRLTKTSLRCFFFVCVQI